MSKIKIHVRLRDYKIDELKLYLCSLSKYLSPKKCTLGRCVFKDKSRCNEVYWITKKEGK